MKEKEKFEAVLAMAISRMEAGEARAEILARFPDFQKELSEAFRIADRFSLLGKDIKPERALLEKIVQEIGAVTPVQEKRFSYISDNSKGRWLFINPFQIQRIMNTQMKFVLPLAVLVILAGGVYYFNQAGSPEFAAKTAEAPLSQGMPAGGDSSVREMVATGEAPSTGNPDEIVADIIASAAQEDAVLNEAAADGDFATYDSAVLTEFGQISYE
ncbi:MAG: hypothetical protein A2847_02140 [Candidatus Sungbacteria bacterium RIFCSPHIGHO2_01_FULL_50_25]|uniref:Uncharacterized protein n=1 Tax=Candidatus Sungbacteria bacterium RIFCSPHIGHO2_01_FULL_50_25 TaxID=1802265 RepID=A0A1G2K6F1_9BACT|nr:MAG: hypothetical protein A2847_02140 [Candidatus Sungbacteria bacterium RIFCSPHIGHO2_01_FULL_50_25]